MAESISAVRVKNWFQTFLTGEQIEAWAERNGDANIQALYDRIAASVNDGSRTTDQFLQSLIRGTDDGGARGIMSMISKRGLTLADVLAGLNIPGLDLTSASTETLSRVLAQALMSGLVSSSMLQENLDGVEPGSGANIPDGEVIEEDLVDPDEIPEPDPIDEPDDADTKTLTFDEQVELKFPWLPQELKDIYAQAWEDTGDETQALAIMRADPTYREFFPGNNRDDGTVRLNEQEYISNMEAYHIMAVSYGLNPAIFQELWIEAIVNGVSPAEMAERFELAFDGILGIELEEVVTFYREAYGIEMTDEAIFASILDPSLADGIIEGRIAIAQVGAAGIASGFGFGEVLPEAERLAGFGFGQQQAFAFFGRASGRVPILSSLARRFRDADSTFDLSEFTDAEIFSDAFQLRRRARLLARESSSFTRDSSIARDRATGALVGLVDT